MFHRHLPLASVAEDILVPVIDRIRSQMCIPRQFPTEVCDQARRSVSQWADFLTALDLSPDPGLVDAAEQGDPEALRHFPRVAAPSPSGASDALWHPALPALDATHIPFVTIDPAGSRDLDQAIHLSHLPPGQPDGATHLVSYAIASVSTFVPPGSPLDVETRMRGMTTYLPDASTPLHPRELSEGAASLLPGQVCPACVWQVRLGPDGARISWDVRRALVRSRAQLTYEQVQEALDVEDLGGAHAETSPLPMGTPARLPRLLREVGQLRLTREAARGGVSARIPEQEVVREEGPGGASHFRLVYRSSPEVEEWNAQVSLLTGICAASTMRRAGCGILRTVPPATPSSLAKLHSVARALGVQWPEEVAYPALVRSISPDSAAEAAFLLEATSLFRGAGYAVFGVPGAPPFPEQGDPVTRHAAIAAEYAHTTAPLRRLVDRWSLEICLAVCAGQRVPTWVVETLVDVPSLMGRAAQRVSAAERESLAAVEALLLAGEVGRVFRGAVVDTDGRAPRNGGNGAATQAPGRTPDADGGEAGTAGAGQGVAPGGGSPTTRGGGPGERSVVRRGTVMIADPAVMGRVVVEEGADVLPLGEVVEVRLVTADIARRRIEFQWPASAPAREQERRDLSA